MNQDAKREPGPLKDLDFAQGDIVSFKRDADQNNDLLTVSNDGRTIEWGPRKLESTGVQFPPVSVPACTRARLHSGRFRWDFVIDEVAGAQLGIGFMVLWDFGPDWEFFGLGPAPAPGPSTPLRVMC